MTNAEILATPDSLLTAVDRQRKFILRMALECPSCPVCRQACNQLEAAGIALDDYTFGVEERRFSCPQCGVALMKVVPLFAVGTRGWLWVRKHDNEGGDR
jgi:hypothetical protein